MGIFTTVEHSAKWLTQHEGSDEPRFGWQTKDVGYGDRIRLTEDGTLEQRFSYIPSENTWIDILFTGVVRIYADFDSHKRWVEYRAVFLRGKLELIELVFDGPTEELYSHLKGGT